jgi:hypothetical protein
MTSGYVQNNVGCATMVNALDLLVGWRNIIAIHLPNVHMIRDRWCYSMDGNGERRFIPPRLTGFEEVLYNCWRIILSIKSIQ